MADDCAENEEQRPVAAAGSSYMLLLSAVANDLDYMLTDLYDSPPTTLNRGDAFLESYIDGLARSQGPEVGGAEDEDQDGNLIRTEEKQFQDSEDFPDSRDFKFNHLSQDEDDYETSSGSVRSGSGDAASCDIGLLERLIRSHPIWFLPGIQRAGAFHLLQGKDDGNFVVRQSSQTGTMAISVRLPSGKGPYIEHYLIQATSDNRLALESSDNKFDSIPMLIAHYAQCCDELPVQLMLPKAIQEAKNRQQLSSLALLGQEFWRYPMASSRSSPTLDISPNDEPTKRTLNTSIPSSAANSQSSSLSSFSSGNNNQESAFTDNHLSIEELSTSPVENTQQTNGFLTTFKSTSKEGTPTSSDNLSPPVSLVSGRTRPTPPNTLNLKSSNSPLTTDVVSSSHTAKTPPPPPPRWAKPVSGQQNFTVTTTVTFSLHKETSPSPLIQVSCGQMSKSTDDSEIMPAIKSPPGSEIMSPISDTGGVIRSGRRTKRNRIKQSRHYRESDILETPNIYHRSNFADKVSDYEDVWGPDSSLSTFKTPSSSQSNSGTYMKNAPELPPEMPPDILEQTTSVQTVTKNTLGLVLPQNQNNDLPSITDSTTSLLSPVSPEAKSPVSEEDISEAKQGSPFYAEPADAIKQAAFLRRKPKSSANNFRNRHSEPSFLHQWPALVGCSQLPRIDSKEELLSPNGNYSTNQAFSSSVDNIPLLRGSRRELLKTGKPVETPRIGPPKRGLEGSWAVDSSWEFIGNENENANSFDNNDQANIEQPSKDCLKESPGRKGPTIQEIILQRLPHLSLYVKEPCSTSCNNDTEQPDQNPTDSVNNNILNLTGFSNLSLLSQNSDEDTRTEFSEPWDSSRWEHLLPVSNKDQNQDHLKSVNRNKSFSERLDPLLAAPRIQALARSRLMAQTGTGSSTREYALQLAADKSTVFARSIDNFVCCTVESKETNPSVVMRNVRQFMSGMKNYLLKHGEKEFQKVVERERSQLKPTEFLNLDVILEGVMNRLVLKELREHIYSLLVDEYVNNGSVPSMVENIHYAKSKSIQDFAVRVRENLVPPNDNDLKKISECFKRLQDAFLPLEKLEHLLSAIALIFNAVKMQNRSADACLGADDFLPLLVWVLVQCNVLTAELEAEYMWGLLHPSLIPGEGGYYLTALCGAVHVLKSYKSSMEASSANGVKTLGSDNTLSYDPLNELKSVLKVVVPDETNGSLLTKTLPVRPHMTTRDVCKIIAHKLRITNPQDYSLFKLIDGQEFLLSETDCPQDIKSSTTACGSHCLFAYKRIDAKIAWPHSPSP
ncbi:protein sprint isoform X4 [Sipha flava]|uniref:Protein sprint isoform X4 n=1 Tax=Sipha flava TaxID=143950 RepID=A0A8B8FTA6_9HEMI|nr:protein sprint isoform X4 [Sipha flava]XP_025413710.1 protein sprint isoform X4 [Sipha flava]XP_025413711.1 protein sprint isoform X4 [Sipha flava]XP_025413712.1 protein sprint isoform X4 [Sipha flava]XP_025413713.1 protein sprint isoform X4 [Sipha flava]